MEVYNNRSKVRLQGIPVNTAAGEMREGPVRREFSAMTKFSQTRRGFVQEQAYSGFPRHRSFGTPFSNM